MTSSTFFPESKSILNDKDKAFLEECIKGISEWLDSKKEEIKDEQEYIDYMHENSPGYLDPAYEEGFENLLKAVACHTQRLEALKKMQDSKPITLEDQQLLLKMSSFQDTIVSRYPLVEEKPTLVSAMQHR